MTEIGTCPTCGSKELEYGSLEIDSNSLAYPFICKCGTTGYEVYSLEFIHMSDRNGIPLENKF